MKNQTMLDMILDMIKSYLSPQIINGLSYVINVISITLLINSWLARKRERREMANYLNGGYEMAERLSASLKEAGQKGQAENIASFLKSVVMNSMDRKRDELGGEGEIPKKWTVVFKGALRKDKK